MGHQVTFDAGRDLWFADIAVDEASLYAPFVRLGLVRYQPNAIPGAEVSAVVTTDPIQLIPTRTTTWKQVPLKPRQFNLTVTGPGPISIQAQPIEVTCEQRDPTLADEVGWKAVGSPTLLSTTTWGGGITTWSGTVTLPVGATGTLRLVVREYEQYPVDPGAGTTGRRTVYLDTLPL